MYKMNLHAIKKQGRLPKSGYDLPSKQLNIYLFIEQNNYYFLTKTICSIFHINRQTD